MITAIFVSLFWCHFVVGTFEPEPYKPKPGIPCSSSSKCPKEWPCCSQYGECGTGPLCITGCKPNHSYNETSCAPIPALLPFLNKTYEFNPTIDPIINYDVEHYMPTLIGQFPNYKIEGELNKRGIIHFTRYMISPNKNVGNRMLGYYDFIHSGFLSIKNSTNVLILGMPKETTGTLVSSTRSFLYGKASITMKTARGRGVVSAMVLMSNVQDEIDFEFIGGELFSAQTNYYHQGELIHTRMIKAPIEKNSFENYNTYEIDWNEDRIHWIINGNIVRTLYKKDTWDAVEGIFKYPQTPMRLEVAIWPGGRKDADLGTIIWAGGLIDWNNSPDMIKENQFYATVKQISIVPYKNKFWDVILQHFHNLGLEPNEKNLKHITYIHEKNNLDKHYLENSVKWKNEISPQLSSWNSSGFNTGILNIPNKIQHHSISNRRDTLILVNKSTDFIQNIGRVIKDQNGNTYYNKTSIFLKHVNDVEKNFSPSVNYYNIVYRLTAWLLR